jgi:hypothetical protein
MPLPSFNLLVLTISYDINILSIIERENHLFPFNNLR